MNRYHYESESYVFVIYDRLRGHGHRVAHCDSCDDAELIVQALNEKWVVDRFDYQQPVVSDDDPRC